MSATGVPNVLYGGGKDAGMVRSQGWVALFSAYVGKLVPFSAF